MYRNADEVIAHAAADLRLMEGPQSPHDVRVSSSVVRRWPASFGGKLRRISSASAASIPATTFLPPVLRQLYQAATCIVKIGKIRQRLCISRKQPLPLRAGQLRRGFCHIRG